MVEFGGWVLERKVWSWIVSLVTFSYSLAFMQYKFVCFHSIKNYY